MNKDNYRRTRENIEIRLVLTGKIKEKFIRISNDMNLQDASNNDVIRAMINKLSKPYKPA